MKAIDLDSGEKKKLKIRNHIFFYMKDVDSEDPSNYTYALYAEDGSYIASAILNFQGVREIAKAYLDGPEEQKDAKRTWCF